MKIPFSSGTLEHIVLKVPGFHKVKRTECSLVDLGTKGRSSFRSHILWWQDGDFVIFEGWQINLAFEEEHQENDP